MRYTAFAPLFSALITTAAAKNILLSNDDGWAATNFRALYRDLKNAGHTVVAVAPAVQMSGNGGKFLLTTSNTLEQDALFSHPAKGAPSWGHEENDINMWYYNGTPAACVAVGLDYVIPRYFNNLTIDLVVGGPNEGNNLGLRDFVLSGTMGAAVHGVERGYPAIAFSGANNNNSFYQDNLDSDPAHAPNIYAKKSVQLIEALFDAQGENPRTLPLSTGLNVNFGAAGTDLGSSCTDLTFYHTRLTGAGFVPYAISYNETSGLVEWSAATKGALGECLAGDCALPAEFDVIKDKSLCGAAISVFTIDGDVLTADNDKIIAKFSSILSP